MIYDFFQSVTPGSRYGKIIRNTVSSEPFGGARNSSKSDQNYLGSRTADRPVEPVWRSDLLQFRPEFEDDPHWLDEFCFYIGAKGPGWHGSFYFFAP